MSWSPNAVIKEIISVHISRRVINRAKPNSFYWYPPGGAGNERLCGLCLCPGYKAGGGAAKALFTVCFPRGREPRRVSEQPQLPRAGGA